MDFLKYLDILIGFTVVMVLLSPLVTTVTQCFLWDIPLPGTPSRDTW